MRISSVAVAAVSLVGLVACGDNGDGGRATPAPTRDEFVRQSDEICTRFSEGANGALAKMFEGGRVLGMDGAAAAFPEFEDSVRSLLEERPSLRPPEADRKSMADVNFTERASFEGLLSDARAAIEAGDAEALGAAFDRADVGFQRIDEIQQAYGFQACGAFEAPPEEHGYELVPSSGPIGTRVVVRSLVPCPPEPSQATGRRVRVSLWSSSTRQSTRGGRILVDAVGDIAGDGRWRVTLTVPPEAIAGKHAVAGRCEEISPYCEPACTYGADLPDRRFLVVPSSGAHS